MGVIGEGGFGHREAPYQTMNLFMVLHDPNYSPPRWSILRFISTGLIIFHKYKWIKDNILSII
jgi:hypothetical protein